MLIHDVNRAYNSVFHSYFDRTGNFNSYVSFNFIEFLKDNSSFPEIYNDPRFFIFIKNLFKFDFYLVNDNNNIFRLDTVEEISLFDNQNIVSLFLKHNTSSFTGQYLVKCVVSFEDGFYDYITNEILVSDDNHSQINKIEIKNILDKKFLNQASVSSLVRTYEFFSDYILFEKKETMISNLLDIFTKTIKLNEYMDFIAREETNKNITYDGTVPLTNFLNHNEKTELRFDLKDKIGSSTNYLKLALLLQNKLNSDLDYKQLGFIDNIFVVDGRPNPRVEIKPSETISSIQSSACENDLFMQVKEKELKESDILFLSMFLNLFNNIDINEYWTVNISLLPVYLLEIVTKFNIFYLSEINENSLYETWLPLTKRVLENMKGNKFLCMISADKIYLQNNMIENYFVLEV